MSDKNKRLLKKIIFWLVFLAIIFLFDGFPSFYWRHSTGMKHGFQALCQYQNTDDLTNVKMTDVFFGKNVLSSTISVSGNIFYDADTEIYYLKNGILSLPLDLSDCQNLDNFKNNEPLVIAKGKVVIDKNNRPLLAINGLHSDIPEWAQIVYSAGVLGSIILVIYILMGIVRGLGRLFAKIGIGKGNEKLSPEELKNRHAGYLLLLGIVSPFAWLLNPYLGIITSLLPLLFWTKDSLKSQKKKIALVGICLCGLNFVVMAFVSIARFSFTKTNSVNFYAGSIWSSYSEDGPKSGLLALDPYINTKENFSIHQPVNWTKDESSEDGSSVKFQTPIQLGVAAGKPIYGKISIVVMTVPNGITMTDLISQVKKEAYKSKDLKLILEKNILLAGSRLEAYTLEATDIQKSAAIHILAEIAQKDNKFYILGTETPIQDWNTYEAAIRDSLRTFELL